MAHLRDLELCTYGFPVQRGRLLAVGWLERGQPFPTGPCAPALRVRLAELLVDPWAPVDFMGAHTCDLCTSPSAPRGMQNLFVPSDDAVYVAPELVGHYIERHRYQPPAEFVAAVMACPPMGSPAYFEALGRTYQPFERPLLGAASPR